jgi:hypothetical protein
VFQLVNKSICRSVQREAIDTVYASGKDHSSLLIDSNNCENIITFNGTPDL